MAGFLDRAKGQAQRGLQQGKDKVGEVQAQRTGGDLLRKLGLAYWRQQRGTGSPQELQQALSDVERHAAAHGDSAFR